MKSHLTFLLVNLCAFSLVQAEVPILGAEQARWGMTQKEISETFSGVKQLPKESRYKFDGEEYKCSLILPTVLISKHKFTAKFAMDKTGQLAVVLLQNDFATDDEAVAAYTEIKDTLSKRHSEPSANEPSSFGDPLPGMIHVGVVWRLAETHIRLVYNFSGNTKKYSVSLRYQKALTPDHAADSAPASSAEAPREIKMPSGLLVSMEKQIESNKKVFAALKESGFDFSTPATLDFSCLGFKEFSTTENDAEDLERHLRFIFSYKKVLKVTINNPAKKNSLYVVNGQTAETLLDAEAIEKWCRDMAMICAAHKFTLNGWRVHHKGSLIAEFPFSSDGNIEVITKEMELNYIQSQKATVEKPKTESNGKK